ncbi:MAG: DUF4129 domain-containing protein [Chloroflexi bacterium]|nr:DUF4129 domain-containing protein [Chloroflexota bacterium]
MGLHKLAYILASTKAILMAAIRMAAILMAVILVVVSLCISPVQGQDQTISLAEYTSQIQSTLEQLEQAPEGAKGDALGEARAVFQNITAVELPSGAKLAIKPLLPEGISYDVALQRLRLMEAQLAAADGDDFTARRALLEKILARPEFNQPGPEESLGARFLKWLRGLLPQDLPVASRNPLVNTLAEIGVWVIAGVGAVLIVLLLSYWLQGLISNFVADVESRRRRAAEEEEPLTAQAARQQAATMARAGDYRGAVRRLYLAALLQLEENGLLRYDRSLTNREYLVQVASSPVLRSQMEPVVRTFDDVWYGVHEPDRETFDRYQQEVRELTNAAPVTGKPAKAPPDQDRYKTRKLTLDE